MALCHPQLRRSHHNARTLRSFAHLWVARRIDLWVFRLHHGWSILRLSLHMRGI